MNVSVVDIASDIPPTARIRRRSGFTIAADGSYAACLAQAEAGSAAGTAVGTSAGPTTGEDAESGAGRWFVERWTLGGPEPYAVPLPGGRSEEPATQVLPLGDGRVLVRRQVADRHAFALLYPTGPGTGELPLCSLAGAEVKLLPPGPVPGAAFALVHDEGVTAVWQVHGHGAADEPPVRVMEVPGRCTGGVWLDRTGRLLALDRELDGRTKAVAADLTTGAISPLLQLTEDSDDRLLLAEPDSGLLMLRSDATGEARIGWGVLGSRHPVRFPDALQVPGALFTPLVAQPGQILSPEAVVVALRAEVPGGAQSLALWRPGGRQLHWRATPRGWLGPTACWPPGGELRLPYALPDWPCGLIRYEPPAAEAGVEPEAEAAEEIGGEAGGDLDTVVGAEVVAATLPAAGPAPAGSGPQARPDAPGEADPAPRLVREPGVCPPSPAASPARRIPAVLPLQQAPLAGARAR
ncbi:hypothetical protein GA0115240_16766 [Streptomyces sp. DvalAA-14]|uniref:hypothetical protein n=1 Tax=unclassified Streptomyces TaxID=2593676 RepID=UPI00081B0CBA|nr:MULTISPECIES: hypothetical protein [unclassified Streptomyces]MYS24716.1 hypothetical protein [Streptomyces sp. SID4948]SCE48725.1 hypothetical protein GA0115240_16766 [Streptomyces sp. DvalAA-14]